MRDAAFLAGRIANRGGEIDDRDAQPCETDGDFGIEIEMPGEARGGENLEQFGRGIYAHAEERIVDPPAEGFEVGEEIGDLAAVDAQGGRGFVEDRPPNMAASGCRAESSRKRGMKDAGCCPSASNDRTCVWPEATASRSPCRMAAPFPELWGRRSSRKRPGMGCFQSGKKIRRAVGGAVGHHPDRGVLAERVAHGMPQDRPGIVTRNEDKRSGRWHGREAGGS